MSNGYFVIEGCDCSGKTTLINNVSTELSKRNIKNIQTKHPGCTPLGSVLRKLTKDPEYLEPLFNMANGQLQVDSFSVQALMMIDHQKFITDILIPELNQDTIVLADRSNFISSIVYGAAEGLSPSDLQRVHQLCVSPEPTLVILLSLPWEEIAKRKSSRSGNDRFEDAGNGFMKTVHGYYDNLNTIPKEFAALLDNYVSRPKIVKISSEGSPESLTAQVVELILMHAG